MVLLKAVHPSLGRPQYFVNGTFGYYEEVDSLPPVLALQVLESIYEGQPYLYIAAGSGNPAGYMYLDWAIATFGVPYVVTVP